MISEQQTKIAHACTNTKEKLYRTNAAITFNKVYLCALVGRIYHNNQNVFQVLTPFVPIMSCFAYRMTRCGYCTPTTVTIHFCVLEPSSVLCRIMNRNKGALELCTSWRESTWRNLPQEICYFGIL